MTELSEYERHTLARIEAAMDAPESLRERIGRALWDAECRQPFGWHEAETLEREDYYRLADAALAVIKGDPS